MKLTSSAFPDGGIIPSVHTCEGKNLPPPLTVSDVPSGAQSLVLICDDPDVPKTLRPDGMYDHWILFNISPATQYIDSRSGSAGRNTNGRNQYIGPCPPDREHRYFFKLYALSTMLKLPAGASKQEVEQAMQGLVLSSCQLMGRYEKGKGY